MNTPDPSYKPFNLEEAKAHPERVCLRNGQPARILAVDLESSQPIVVAVANGDGEHLQTHFLDGGWRPSGTFPSDLVLRVEDVVKWVNVYRRTYQDGYFVGFLFNSKEDALKDLTDGAGARRVATLPLTFPGK